MSRRFDPPARPIRIRYAGLARGARLRIFRGWLRRFAQALQPSARRQHRSLRDVSRLNPEYFSDEVRISQANSEVSITRPGSVELTKMDARSAKARSSRKARPLDGGRKAKVARAAGAASATKPRRVARAVKRGAGRHARTAIPAPMPANDTLPLPPEGEAIGLPGLPLEDLEPEATLVADAGNL